MEPMPLGEKIVLTSLVLLFLSAVGVTFTGGSRASRFLFGVAAVLSTLAMAAGLLHLIWMT